MPFGNISSNSEKERVRLSCGSYGFVITRGRAVAVQQSPQSSLRFLGLATTKVVCSSSDHQTSHNFRRPEKITHDSFGRLSRPRPFSQLGFSKVAPAFLLVMIDFALDPRIEVRNCGEIISPSHPSSCA